MKANFLRDYLAGFRSIEGWFSPDAALMFMAYNQLLAAEGIAGATLEIGVHRGLSAIAVASLRGAGHRFVAVDLFEELQSQNVSGSGMGSKAHFLQNMKTFYGDIGFVHVLTAVSADLEPADLGSGLSFCHIDGGHSAAETCRDLELCHEVLAPGGLIALDDYFNPNFPGVCEGALDFRARHPDTLLPIATGYNKVLFQKLPAPFDLNARFEQAFPRIPRSIVLLWGKPAFLFGSEFGDFIDLDSSSPLRLAPRAEIDIAAALEPELTSIQAQRGQAVELAVRVVNRSSLTFRGGDMPFGLSYHLLTGHGEMLRFENPRQFFESPLRPGEARVMTLPIHAPGSAGSYRVEIDVVWEGNMWFKDRGSPTAFVDLAVV